MEKDLKDMRMAILILVNLKMVKQMEKEYTLGQTEKFMMVNGKLV
jgi:hypothetical protein